MAELTARDDIRKKVSEILKRVDRLIRAGEIDQAMREIINAKEVDPRNVYIFAYEERIAYLKEEHERHKAEERTRKQAEEAARKRVEKAETQLEPVSPKPKAPSQPPPEEKPPRPTVAEKPEEEKPQPPPGQQKEDTQTLEQLEAELRTAEKELHRQTKEEDAKRESLAAHADALVKYKAELVKAWADGATTPMEDNQLKELRFTYAITLEEHTKLTKEAQRESYIAAFRDAWASGSITPERASELADLRKRFQISAEEFDKMEAEILWQIRTGLQPPVVTFIDDDVRLLNVVTETLREAGYDVKSYTTSDDAYQYLKAETPDLIISDINLETSTMGGFTFYEKVRELEHLHDIPFIFLSGLTDEILVRTGKELGVDDYLTKPFSDETLLATIRGKLKRFKQLRESRNKKDTEPGKK